MGSRDSLLHIKSSEHPLKLTLSSCHRPKLHCSAPAMSRSHHHMGAKGNRRGTWSCIIFILRCTRAASTSQRIFVSSGERCPGGRGGAAALNSLRQGNVTYIDELTGHWVDRILSPGVAIEPVEDDKRFPGPIVWLCSTSSPCSKLHSLTHIAFTHRLHSLTLSPQTPLSLCQGLGLYSP